MDRSFLYRPELADPFYRPGGMDLLWGALLGLSSVVYLLALPWVLSRGSSASFLEVAFLTGAALAMAADLPFSLIRFKQAGEWKRYRRRWLVPDLLAALPFLFLALSAMGILEGTLARQFALLGLVKGWKVRHLILALGLRALRYANAIALGSLLFWASVTIHWIAVGWLSLRGYDHSAGAFTNYVDSLYWTVTTLTAVGYGDITPNGEVEKVYALMTMVAGLAFFGYLVGLLASFWSRRDPGRTEFFRNVEQLSQAVRATHLPPALQHRVYDYYSYMWREREWYDETDFLRELPPTLRSEVAAHMKQDVLHGVELFRGADERFCREVAANLHWEVLTPGGYVFHEGDSGDRMYFIVRGEVEILKGSTEEAVATMGPGDFFGEIALFTEGVRTASVRASGFTEVYWLSKSAFQRVVARYPDEVEPIREKARARSGGDGANVG